MGTKFDQVMEEQGRKATWLAEQTGFSSALISRVRSGERRPSPAFKRAAAKALEMTVDELFPETEQAAA